MGQDIHGWVEICWNPEDDEWSGVIRVPMLVERNRRFWRWMFQRWGDFPSVAADRGIPDNASYDVKAEFESWKPYVDTADCHSMTWATWAEIEAVDWDAGPKPGPLGTPREAVYFDVHTIRPDSDGVMQSTIVKEELRTRRDTLKGYPGWELLFDLMRRLAQNYRPEHVRLVVWFDG
jgi:hypothetical protein